jgi:hypothetical protein
LSQRYVCASAMRLRASGSSMRFFPEPFLLAQGYNFRFRPTWKDCANLFEPSGSLINKGHRFPVSYFRECCLESSSWSIHLLSLEIRNTQLLPFFVAGEGGTGDTQTIEDGTGTLQAVSVSTVDARWLDGN